MGLRVEAASAFDMLEALGDDGGRARLTRQRFGQMARQVSEGAAMTLRDDAGRLVCVIGLWPEADHAEAWLAIGPGFRDQALGALRIAGRMMAGVCADAGVAVVRTYVELGWTVPERVAGLRMAAWLGFTRVGTEAVGSRLFAVLERSIPGATS